MKTQLQLVTFAIAVGVISCSAPPSVTVREYSAMTKLDEPIPFPETLTLSVKEPGKPTKAYPSLRISPGKAITIADRREFIYPSSYEPAAASPDGVLTTPATPADYRTEYIGFSADLSTSSMGSLILIEGSVTVKEFAGFSRMGGELGKPILDGRGRVLTENRIEMPKFTTFTTPVHVAVRSETPAEFEIGHPTKGTKVVITVRKKE